MAPSTTGKRSSNVIVPVASRPLNMKDANGMTTPSPGQSPPSSGTSIGPETRNPKRESVRLASYRRWPVKFMNPRDLARAGFYYTGECDIIKCAFCGVEIGYWENGDDPRADHAKWSPRCDFVNNRDCGNVPTDAEEEREGEGENETSNYAAAAGNEETGSYDTCGCFKTVLMPYSGPERAPPHIGENELLRDMEHLGVSKTYGPAAPTFNTYESRLKTFDKWPSDRGTVRPEDLAAAGFYYLQYHDNTMCFYCGGGLNNWNADDDPWVEHARWFYKCGFVIMQKGQEFVDRVLAREHTAAMPDTVAVESHTGRNVEDPTAGSDPVDQNEETTATPIATTTTTTSSTTGPAVDDKVPVTTCNSSSSTCSSPREIELCRICFVRERSIVFLPCGHFVSCRQCAPSLSKCPVCCKPYEATVRAYLS